MRVASWSSLFVAFWDNSSLNERGFRCSPGTMQIGLLSGASSVQVPARRADRPVTLPVNNATLHSRQPPIRKTAETQRGGENQHVTDTASLHVKEA